MASDNQVQLLACSSGLVSKPGGTASTDRRRGEGGYPALQNQSLRADGGSSTWEGSSSRGRKTLISNLRCLAAYPATGKASGVNPEEKSGAGVPKAVCGCLQLHSGNSCDVGSTKLYRLLQPWSVLNTTLPRPAPWRGHSSVASPATAKHGKQQSTGNKPHSIGVVKGARGCFRRWERPSRLIGQLPPALAVLSPASKVLSRHSPPASLGAWSSGLGTA